MEAMHSDSSGRTEIGSPNTSNLRIVFAIVYTQTSTMFVLQGNTMDQSIGPHFKIPSASLSLFDKLSVIFWVPIYDRFIVPLARRLTGHERRFTLQRMGIFLVISTAAMIAAAVMKVARLDYVRKNGLYDGGATVSMSIFWQMPQYFLIGCAVVFTIVAQWRWCKIFHFFLNSILRSSSSIPTQPRCPRLVKYSLPAMSSPDLGNGHNCRH